MWSSGINDGLQRIVTGGLSGSTGWRSRFSAEDERAVGVFTAHVGAVLEEARPWALLAEERAHLQAILQRLYRKRLPARDQRPEVDLGLSITKGLVEAHGGRIRAESVPGDSPRPPASQSSFLATRAGDRPRRTDGFEAAEHLDVDGDPFDLQDRAYPSVQVGQRREAKQQEGKGTRPLRRPPGISRPTPTPAAKCAKVASATRCPHTPWLSSSRRSSTIGIAVSSRVHLTCAHCSGLARAPARPSTRPRRWAREFSGPTRTTTRQPARSDDAPGTLMRDLAARTDNLAAAGHRSTYHPFLAVARDSASHCTSSPG